MFISGIRTVIMGIRQSGMYVISEMYLVEKFIWTFHVALFMFLSGYVFSLNGGCKNSPGNFLLHKLLNLGVPYITFSIIYIIINSIAPGVNNKNNIKDILHLLKDPIAQYWFLYALFFIFCFYALSCRNLNNRQILILFICIYYFAPLLGIQYGSLGGAASMMIAFGLGAALPKLYINTIKWYFKILIIICHVFILFTAIHFDLQNISVIKPLIQIIGIAASISVVSFLVKLSIVEKFLLFINKYSFPIYLLHTIFTAGFRVLWAKIELNSYFLFVILSLVVGIIFPIFISMFTSKFLYFDFFFYPSRTIKKIKKIR